MASHGSYVVWTYSEALLVTYYPLEATMFSALQSVLKLAAQPVPAGDSLIVAEAESLRPARAAWVLPAAVPLSASNK
jgi:hypothetical protein